LSTLQSRSKDALSGAPATPGIVREFAFKAADALVIRARVEPGVVSGWHHHGDYDVYGYVVSGTMRFEGGPGGHDSITVTAGDFFHVPAQLVHRDINPSTSEGHEGILFLSGSGPMVVNVDGPEPA
jgi:quercetin dioxygenase-like cupin family protein